MKNTTLLLTITTLIVTLTHGLAQALPTPVAEFRFQGNLSDSTGNLPNAVNFGGAFTTNRFGVSNTAIGFNGAQYASISDLGTVLSGHDGVTLSAWFRFEFYRTQPFVQMVGLKQSDGAALSIGINGAPAVTAKLGSSADLNSSNTIEYGEWYHLVGTFEVGSTAKAYLNGQEVTWVSPWTPSTITEPVVFNTDFGVGTEFIDGVPYFGNYIKGAISDLAFYSSALTSQEVTDLYNAQRVEYEVTLTLKSSTNMRDWTPVLTNIVETYNPQEFYKNDISVRIKAP